VSGRDAVPGDEAQLRTLAPGDSVVELTALLHRAYARLGAMGLNYTAVDQSPEATARRLGSGTCFVALQGGRIVGTILVHPTYARNDCAWFTRAGVACIHQFAVDPALQGNGLGRRLLQRAEDWAREHGFAEVAMDTAEEAAHLLAFYARAGYEAVDTVQWAGKVYRSVVLRKPLA
jgi:GNAT superfamily N-acetyltransferase